MVHQYASLSRWTLPILRIGMGIFLITWGLDKWLATEGSLEVFSVFYGLEVGGLVVRIAGALEILLGLALVLGILPVVTSWAQLVVNAISTLASWRQILDPWGRLGLTEGGMHLFLASIVVMAVSVVLVLNVRRSQKEALPG
ncbi:MAG TPA: DoxX family protein [Gemmatimonadota bacterium]|nr:DoxX family protein [Gemmatimonadota bacterium]